MKVAIQVKDASKKYIAIIICTDMSNKMNTSNSIKHTENAILYFFYTLY